MNHSASLKISLSHQAVYYYLLDNSVSGPSFVPTVIAALYPSNSVFRPNSSFLKTYVCRRSYLEQEQIKILLVYTQMLPMVLVVRIRSVMHSLYVVSPKEKEKEKKNK